MTTGKRSYGRSRALVLIAGIVVLSALAVFSYLRGVDKVEVAANLLFIPVFLAFLWRGILGGSIAGVLAAGAYVWLRMDAIDTLGFDAFSSQIAYRAFAFPLFGVMGGWAMRQLGDSLTKLELYDQIDDSTGLNNARFFVQGVDLEASRSQRYRTIFSVIELDFPDSPLASLSRRRRERVLRRLGEAVNEKVRTVDRAIHGFDGKVHRLAVILPETSSEGAAIFSGRFREFLAERFQTDGAMVGVEQIGLVSATLPGDEAVLESMKKRFADIDRTEHPAPATTTP